MEKNNVEKKKSFSFFVGVIIVIVLIAVAVYFLFFFGKGPVSTTPVATNAPIHVVVDSGKVTVDNTDANPVKVNGSVTVNNTIDNPVNVKEVNSCCGGDCKKNTCSVAKTATVQKEVVYVATPPACTSVCTFGAKQCVGNQVQTCGLMGSCYNWQATQNCASNEYCSNGSCVRNQQVENRCYNNDVYKYVDGSMVDLVENCGINTFEEERCNGSDLQRKHVERGCENSSCYSRVTWKYQESCSYGCSGNRCSRRSSQSTVAAAQPVTVNVTVNVSQSQAQTQSQPVATQQQVTQESHTGTSFSVPVDQNLASSCTATGTCGSFTPSVGSCTGANCTSWNPPASDCTVTGTCGTFTPGTGASGGTIVPPPTN